MFLLKRMRVLRVGLNTVGMCHMRDAWSVTVVGGCDFANEEPTSFSGSEVVCRREH
jgi:hypothetical protein